MSEKHRVVTDNEDWLQKHPLIAAINSLERVRTLMGGEIVEFTQEVPHPLIGSERRLKAAGEIADVAIFALSLCHELGMDPSSLLKTLDQLSFPATSLTYSVKRLKFVKQEMEARAAITSNGESEKPKTLHVQETFYYIWLVLKQLGMDPTVVITTRSAYNRKRYPEEAFQIGDLTPQQFLSAYSERRTPLKEISKARNDEEVFFYEKIRKHRKDMIRHEPAPRAPIRLQGLQTWGRKTARTFASALTALGLY